MCMCEKRMKLNIADCPSRPVAADHDLVNGMQPVAPPPPTANDWAIAAAYFPATFVTKLPLLCGNNAD